MKRIVLATSNPGKVRELKALLTDLPIEILPQSEFNVPEVEETGLSFVENAILKARNAACHSHLPALADDSGLVVDVLDGAPGIYSARYAGADASDRDNIRKLLPTLQDTPDSERGARFYCLVVYLHHALDPMPLICEGVWEGVIVHEPRGTGGFGYDPVFLVPAEDKTAAELDPAVKNRLSHRGQSLNRLLAVLKQQYGS